MIRSRYFEVKKSPDKFFSQYCCIKYDFDPLEGNSGEGMKSGDLIVVDSFPDHEKSPLSEFLMDFLDQGVIQEIEEDIFYKGHSRKIKWHVGLE